jgi:hypothetical protein
MLSVRRVLSGFVPQGLNDRSQAIYCLATIVSPFGTIALPELIANKLTRPKDGLVLAHGNCFTVSVSS